MTLNYASLLHVLSLPSLLLNSPRLDGRLDNDLITSARRADVSLLARPTHACTCYCRFPGNQGRGQPVWSWAAATIATSARHSTRPGAKTRSPWCWLLGGVGDVACLANRPDDGGWLRCDSCWPGPPRHWDEPLNQVDCGCCCRDCWLGDWGGGIKRRWAGCWVDSDTGWADCFSACSLSSELCIASIRVTNGVRSTADDVTRLTADSFTSAKRTAFFGLVLSIVAAEIHACLTVCAKARLRWCNRRYCDNSTELTPSSKRRLSAASRWSDDASGHASLYRIRNAVSYSTSDSVSDCRRESKRRIASLASSIWPKRWFSRFQRSSSADATSRRNRDALPQPDLPTPMSGAATVRRR